MSKKEIKLLIASAILLVVGILFCFSLSTMIISIIIGSALILMGILFVVSSFINKKNLITTESLIGAALVAFGVLFIWKQLFSVLLDYIPFLSIAFGIVIIIDGIYREVSSKDTVKFVFELIVGIIAIAFGVCLLIIEGFRQFCSIIVGIVMIIYAIYVIASLFIKKTTSKD